MLTGVGLNDTSLVTNLSGVDFAYFRARKIDKDDQKFTFYKDTLTSLGKPYGVFVDFDYRTNSPLGSKQAQELADKDRGFSPLLPYIRISPIEGSAYPAWSVVAAKLSEMVYYYREVYGKRNVGISTSVGIIKALVPHLTDELIKCWFNVVYYSDSLPVMPSPFSTFPYWEQTNYDYMGEGFSKACKVAWPGTVEELVAWNKDSTSTIPTWEVEPEPEVPPVDDEDFVEVDLTAVVTAIEENTVVLNKVNETLQEMKQGFMTGWSL